MSTTLNSTQARYRQTSTINAAVYTQDREEQRINEWRRASFETEWKDLDIDRLADQKLTASARRFVDELIVVLCGFSVNGIGVDFDEGVISVVVTNTPTRKQLYFEFFPQKIIVSKVGPGVQVIEHPSKLYGLQELVEWIVQPREETQTQM